MCLVSSLARSTRIGSKVELRPLCLNLGLVGGEGGLADASPPMHVHICTHALGPVLGLPPLAPTNCAEQDPEVPL